MSRAYQPKHRITSSKTRMPIFPAKPFIAAGLVGAMLAPHIVPVAAWAINPSSDEGAADATSETVAPKAPQKVPTKYSVATQRLVDAVDGKIKLELAEAKNLLDEVSAAVEAAKQEQKQAQEKKSAAADERNEAEHNYTTADAQALAELEKQAKALVAQMEKAKSNAEQAQKDKQQAEDDLTKTKEEYAKAQQKVADAEAAYTEADEALKKAQQDRDALGEDPTKAEREAVEAAQKAYDDAVAEKAAKLEAKNQAEADLKKLQDEQKAKTDEQTKLGAQIPTLQRKAADAQAALDAAQAKYAGSVEQLKADAATAEKKALQDAKDALTTAQAGGDTAAIKQAEEQVKTAQAAYDKAIAQAGSALAQEKETALANAQQAVSDAEEALATTKERIAAIPAEIDKLNADIAAEDAKVRAAKQAATAADTALNAANDKLDAAQDALQKLQDQQQAWQEKYDELSGKLDAAKEEVTNTAAALKESQDDLAQLKTQKTELEKKIEQTKEQLKPRAVEHMLDFLTWLDKKTFNAQTGRSAATTALNLISYAAGGGSGTKPPSKDGVSIASSTHLGSRTDATHIDNMLASLDAIDKCNELRQGEGIDTLKVSLVATVIAQMNTNWQVDNLKNGEFGHASYKGYRWVWGNAWGENINVGYGVPRAFDDWYWQEKATYTKSAQTDPVTGRTYQPENGGQTGHYTTIVRPVYKYTGFGYAQGVPGYIHTMAQEFGAQDNWSQDETSYSTAELRALMQQAKQEGIVPTEDEKTKIQAEIATLEAELNTLSGKIQGAEHDVATAQTNHEGAQAAQTAAEKALADHGTKPDSSAAEAAVAEAQTQANQAQQVKKDADQKLTDTQAAATAAKDKLQKQIDALTQEKTEKQNSLADLNADITRAKDVLTQLEQRYAGLSESFAELTAAQKTATEADKQLKDGLDAFDELGQALGQLRDQIAAAEETRNQAQAAYEAVDPETKKPALQQAQANLAQAQTHVDELNQAVVAAQEKRDAAKKAKQAAQDEVAALQDKQAKLEQSIKDLEAQANEQIALADAWRDVFNNQSAEDIVKNGLTAPTNTDVISQSAKAAHEAYQQAVNNVAAAQAVLKKKEQAYADAAALAKNTTQALAEQLADLAVAQDAYNRLAERQKPVAKHEKHKTAKSTKKHLRKETLPQTGDAGMASALGVAFAGVIGVAGSRLRRRRSA